MSIDRKNADVNRQGRPREEGGAKQHASYS